MTEAATASSLNPPPPRVGWIANGAALLARIGADVGDDEELRQKKALLVVLAVLILPVSVVWGSLYLILGSPVGVVPFVYFAVEDEGMSEEELAKLVTADSLIGAGYALEPRQLSEVEKSGATPEMPRVRPD